MFSDTFAHKQCHGAAFWTWPAKHQTKQICIFCVCWWLWVGGCAVVAVKRCESIPMCLTRTEMCPKTIGCSDDAFLRCAWVWDWLPALCFLTSHADGTDTYIHTHKPLRSAAPAPGMATASEWALASCISKLSINLERCMENDAPRWKLLFSVKLTGSWECRNVLGGDRVYTY